MLDLKRLRVLREVALQGSFSAAAESLYVSQSAISQQIAALEAETGVPLLVRLRSGPVLTEAGELLVTHADAAICRLEEAERELAELAGLGAGEIRVISFPSAIPTIVANAAVGFRESHPEVGLRLSEAEPEDAIPQLKRGDFDLAVVYDFELSPFEADRDLELTPLLTERMHAMVAVDHAFADSGGIRLEQLADEKWLCGTTEGSCRQLTLRSCEGAGFVPNIAYESDDYTVMQSLVAAGLGVTLIPDLALAALNPGVRVLPILPEPPVRRVWAATLVAGSRSGATETMLAALAAQAESWRAHGAPAAAA
jgi:DNA-binding transcriptional LysR family regulator